MLLTSAQTALPKPSVWPPVEWNGVWDRIFSLKNMQRALDQGVAPVWPPGSDIDFVWSKTYAVHATIFRKTNTKKILLLQILHKHTSLGTFC